MKCPFNKDFLKQNNNLHDYALFPKNNLQLDIFFIS